MELCKPKTLAHRLLPEYRMKIGITRIEAFRIFSQIVQGIIYLHGKKIIHRDLKPANIFFSLDNMDTVKIGDFGIAKHEVTEESDDDTSTTTTYTKGTIPYMAPEQKSSNNEYPLTRKVDIYAMGIILCELLYPCETRSQRSKVLQDMRLERPIFPKDADDVLEYKTKEVGDIIYDHLQTTKTTL
ncbi:unnamed protein product [Adineta steineri]|uniref:non-specific serine/threonine protein kinase n=1 Tax=Adineta steineri TaxID=433720 RepID=A0A819UC52_9BILA|nr:unnamed protein product [Adineta steineri]CAF1501047.1 unnamed protein product [Adineta steineri]CAF3522481.1 unnamed protein product [Adineta steineri]CAF4092225.1 unnamed protein product [Adineta steineri]